MEREKALCVTEKKAVGFSKNIRSDRTIYEMFDMFFRGTVLWME